VCSDPDLPFFAIAQSMRERVESERKGEHDGGKTDGAPPSTDGDSAPVKRESREEGEISDDNMDEDEVENHDNNDDGAEDDNNNDDNDDDGMNGEEGEGGKKQAHGVKRKRSRLLNRQVIDFPRETVLAKRLDYILKVALSSQMPDFVKRESSSSTSTSTSSSSSSSRAAAAADSRKQQSLDRFVKKDPPVSKEKEKEKEKKRKRGDSDHEDHEAAPSSSTTRNGGKSSSSSSSTAQARKKTKRSPSPVPARDHHAKERRDHHGAKEREREKDDEKESGSAKAASAASAKGKKKGGKGGDKTPRTKKIVDLPTDEHGRVKMPIKIAGLTVLALGTVPHGPCTCACVRALTGV
jgi:hypothetical protein